MSEGILKMAKTISDQEKQIEKLEKQLNEEKLKTEKFVARCSDYEARVRALKIEYGADYGGDGMFKTIQEALRVQTELNKDLMSENQKLHARVDKVFGGAQMDKAAKQRYYQAIIERLESIKISIEAVKD